MLGGVGFQSFLLVWDGLFLAVGRAGGRNRLLGYSGGYLSFVESCKYRSLKEL